MKRILPLLIVIGLIVPSDSASAITFGCSKAQVDAKKYLTMTLGSISDERSDLKKGRYDSAFSSFQYANKWYSEWISTIKKSSKCFSGTYISSSKLKLKSASVNQTMQTRYGQDIARRYNYGSPDPCFKYLGEDNAYLECSMSNY